MNNFKIKLFESFDNDLKNIWIDFEKDSYHFFFQKFEWQRLWFNQNHKYNKKIKCYIIIVLRDDEVIMILPLSIQEKLNIKFLTWSGFPFSDYNSPLIKKDLKINQNDFDLIWKKVLTNNKNQFDCIIFENQPYKIEQEINPFQIYLNSKANNFFYGIKFDKLVSFNKKEINNSKYQKRKLNNIGKLEFKIAKKKEEKKRVLNFLIKHKSYQYKKTKAWNLMKYDIYRNFFILSNLKLENSNYISYLTLDDKIIASHVGFIYKNRCYYLFPTYNEIYKKFSPGKILLMEIIEDCKNKMVNYFDFTIGNENYKKKYSNNVESSFYYYKPLNLKSFFYILYLRIKMILKKKYK